MVNDMQTVVELQQKLFDLRVKLSTNELKDNSQISKTRKEIARALTSINMRK